MNEIILYVLFGVLGVIIGYLLTFKGYKRKVLEVLDTLKILNQIDDDKYDYFKDKFIDKQDSLKRVRETLATFRKKENDIE